MNSLNPSGWVRLRPYYYYGRQPKHNYRFKSGALLILIFMGFFAFRAGLPFLALARTDVPKPAAVVAVNNVETPTPINAAPAVVPAINDSAALQNVVDSWVAAHSSNKWSISVMGVDEDKRTASSNMNQIFDTASMFKLLLTPKLFATYNLNSLASKTLSVQGRGDTTLQDCVERMLKYSDNPCGEAVGDLLGWSRANSYLRQYNLLHTNLNNPTGPTSTAGDVALFLYKLQTGQLFDAATTSYLLGLMQAQTLRGGIPTGCPSCTVADKTGDLGYIRHDAGIVSYPGGKYVLSVFTNGVPYSQIAQLTAQIQTVMSTH